MYWAIAVLTRRANRIVVSGSIFLYTNYVYKSYIIDGFSRYPEPVAVKLRRALYFTNVSLDAKQALKYYRLALEKAEEAQMHPFSDEVLGIRIQVAALLEKCSAHAQSAQVLEAIRQDCLSWIEERGGGIDGLKEPLSLPPSPLPPPPPPPLASTSSSSTPSPIPSQTVSLVAPPDPVQLRTKLLKRAVAISVKLGDLYADAFIGDRDAAEEHLVWAVETTLRERERRRRRQHQAPDEPPSRTARGAARKTLIRMPASEGPVAVADGDEWMSDDEIGASMECRSFCFLPTCRTAVWDIMDGLTMDDISWID